MSTYLNSYQKRNKLNRCFFYKNVHQTSFTIDKLSLFYTQKKDVSLKPLVKVAALLELITRQRAFFIRSRKSSVFRKIRKGAPSGVKVTLRKNVLACFLIKLIWEIFPVVRNFRLRTKFDKLKQEQLNSLIYLIPDPLVFREIKNFYFLFKACVNLRVSISFSKNLLKKEFFFNVRFLQLPVA